MPKTVKYKSRSNRHLALNFGDEETVFSAELAEAENLPSARTRSVLIKKADAIALAHEILAYYGVPTTPAGPPKLGKLPVGSFVKNFSTGKIAKIIVGHGEWGATAEYQSGERCSIYNAPDELWWHPVTIEIETTWKEV